VARNEGGFQLAPFGRAHQQRHRVQLPQALHAQRIAVDVVGDPLFLDDAAGRFMAPLPFRRAEIRDRFCKRLVGVAQAAVPVRASSNTPVCAEYPANTPPVHVFKLSSITAIAATSLPKFSAHRQPSYRRGHSTRKSRVKGKSRLTGSSGGWKRPCLAVPEKARQAAAFGFVAVHGKRVVAASARMRDVIGAAAERTLVPGVIKIKHAAARATPMVGCKHSGGCHAR
jgi:hypothetical protein